jgi:lipoprotein-releasing system permease protein
MNHNGITFFLARKLAWHPQTESRRKKSPAVTIAVSGVALSIVVMILSVAVVMGFKDEVRNQILERDDAVNITAYAQTGEMKAFDRAATEALITLPDGAYTVGHIEISGILKTPDDFLGVNFRSAPAEVCNPDSADCVRLSRKMAAQLSLSVGDRVPAYFFIDNRLRVRMLTVASLYTSGVDEQDGAVAYCAPQLPAALLSLPDGYVQSIGVKGIGLDESEAVAQQIHDELMDAYYTGQTDEAFGISQIKQTGAGYFAWLDLLDTNVVVILTLMSAVAAFTLISSLFIIILERVKTIGLLKSLGAPNRLIRRTFMLLAERMVITGLLIGNVVGIALIQLQMRTHLVPLDPDAYFVDFVPMRFEPWSIVVINLGALALSWLVLMLPAMIVARISPATTMRYE